MIDAGRFAMVPIEVARDPELAKSPLSLRVLILLFGHADRDGHCYPKQSMIVEELGVDAPLISRAIGRLVELGWVQKEKRERYGYVYRLRRRRLVVHDNSQEASRVVAHDKSRARSRLVVHDNVDLSSTTTSDLSSTTTSIEEQTKGTDHLTDHPPSAETGELFELPAVPIPKPKAAPSSSDQTFAEIWAAYPSRGDATNPKKPAREIFQRLIAKGLDASAVLRGVKGYAAAMQRSGKAGTDKVQQLVTFLNQETWRQYERPSNGTGGAGAASWKNDPDAWRDQHQPPPWDDAPSGTHCGVWLKTSSGWVLER